MPETPPTAEQAALTALTEATRAVNSQARVIATEANVLMPNRWPEYAALVAAEDAAREVWSATWQNAVAEVTC